MDNVYLHEVEVEAEAEAALDDEALAEEQAIDLPAREALSVVSLLPVPARLAPLGAAEAVAGTDPTLEA